MHEECLICKAPLVYATEATMMECMICHKQEMSKTSCVEGHYVCNDCHSAGLDQILGLCLNETSSNPIEILEKMMSMSFCHIHGPEHHVMVGASLLTAYHNAGGQIELAKALQEMIHRGKQVPGGVCGFWGACGAGISTGQFVSIATNTTPLTITSWGLANQMSAKALEKIGQVNGPRCCKRDSYLAILTAIEFSAKHLNVEMQQTIPTCTRSSQNNQCIKARCSFYRVES